MIQSRAESEEHERQTLAPWAAKSADSRGRLNEEGRNSRRLAFQRDRDRIINAKSFRRLEYKTQVFVNGTADHYRTRLTHTIEMASVARTLARGLRANEDLTAAIALAHDIGHSPFGHCGVANVVGVVPFQCLSVLKPRPCSNMATASAIRASSRT